VTVKNIDIYFIYDIVIVETDVPALQPEVNVPGTQPFTPLSPLANSALIALDTASDDRGILAEPPADTLTRVLGYPGHTADEVVRELMAADLLIHTPDIDPSGVAESDLPAAPIWSLI